jgi:hypothetical protein
LGIAVEAARMVDQSFGQDFYHFGDTTT